MNAFKKYLGIHVFHRKFKFKQQKTSTKQQKHSTKQHKDLFGYLKFFVQDNKN